MLDTYLWEVLLSIVGSSLCYSSHKMAGSVYTLLNIHTHYIILIKILIIFKIDSIAVYNKSVSVLIQFMM